MKIIQKTKSIFKTGVILFMIITCLPMILHAQMINFVNYNEAQVMYNPAMLSSINRTQVLLNYRNTKTTNDVKNYTTMVGLQLPLGIYTSKLNLGTLSFSAFNDQSNYAPSIKNTGFSIAYSQPVQVTIHSFVSIGIQCNVYEKKLDLSNFTTGSQWDSNMGFDPSLLNNEDKLNTRINNYSFHSGLYWQLNNNNNRTKAYAGLSLFNINRPNETFTGKEYKLPWRYLIQGGYTIGENVLGNIRADALWLTQDKQNTGGFGIKAGIYYGTNTSGIGEIAMTARYFTNNTLMVGASIEHNPINFGISYDFITTQSVASNYHSNAIEVFLKLSFGNEKRRQSPVSPTLPSNYNVGQKRVFTEERKTEVMENFAPDSLTLKKVASTSDTSSLKYEPMKIALKRDFKFAFNDATLNAEAKDYLNELTALMKRNKNITLEIIGHTDDMGSQDGNLKISIKRAQIVADYIEKNGIDKHRLKVIGKMDSEPLFPNSSPENRSKNRRVEFIILN